MYDGVLGYQWDVKESLRDGDVPEACINMNWTGYPQCKEVRTTACQKSYTPRVHQFLQGFVRSKE